MTQYKGRVELEERRELKNQSCQENQDPEGTRSYTQPVTAHVKAMHSFENAHLLICTTQ